VRLQITDDTARRIYEHRTQDRLTAFPSVPT
jgi:hypothetical protein